MNKPVSTTIFIDNCCDDEAPEPDSIQRWVDAAITRHMNRPTTAAELSIRIVGETEGSVLNKQYRGKSGPTNVLSFAADLPDFVASPLLGDIVICADLVREEAREQGKQEQAHWAHLIIHGTLHLLGYDHIEETDAVQMEALETEILSSLSFPAPYAIHADAAGCIPGHVNAKNDNKNS